MSFTMVSNEFFALGLDPYTQAVFTAIKTHFPNMRPGIRTIARKAQCSHVTVMRRLKLLSSVGVLSVVKGRRGQWSQYRINERYLTPAEAKAQKQGSWAGISRVATFFARPNKVVNASTPAYHKVVNGVDPNKIPYKQDASDGGFVAFSSTRGLWDWTKGLPPSGFSI